jgi:putative transcriptional regulator
VIDNRLSEILGRRRIGVSELARETGISRGALHKLYHDQSTSFDRDVLDKLCNYLQVQVGELLMHIPDTEGEDA